MMEHKIRAQIELDIASRLRRPWTSADFIFD
jgi:hypothetical protein